MAATYLDLTCHIIFATKHRQPWIADPWRDRLHAYIGGILRNMRAMPIAIGGTSDHVHLLVGLRGTHAVADIVKDVKTASNGGSRKNVLFRRSVGRTVTPPYQSVGIEGTPSSRTSPTRRSTTGNGRRKMSLSRSWWKPELRSIESTLNKRSKSARRLLSSPHSGLRGIGLQSVGGRPRLPSSCPSGATAEILLELYRLNWWLRLIESPMTLSPLFEKTKAGLSTVR